MVDKDRTTIELTVTDKDHIEIIQGGTGAVTIIGAIRLALRAYALEVSLQMNAQQRALDEQRQIRAASVRSITQDLMGNDTE